MESIVAQLKSELKTAKIEMYENIMYQVMNEDPVAKEKIKSLLKQGDCTTSHTVVEIDFTDRKPQKSRRKKDSSGIFSFKCNDAVVKVYNSPIFVYGEYTKMSRNMCQTPLTIGGKLKTERSVSDFASQMQKFFGGSAAKFMACGREDIDVRCLEGRPFVVEISNPTVNLNGEEMDIDMYQDVNIINCRIAKKECKDFVNCSEPSKFYNLLLFSHKEINIDDHYVLQQRTPLRVLHRRADMVRTKTIDVLKIVKFEHDGFYYEIDIRASSGAYIKEWVNGDFERTIPNLGSDLLELDVIRVDLAVPDELFIRPFKLNKCAGLNPGQS